MPDRSIKAASEDADSAYLNGIAFKPDTDDLRDAPALDIARRLIERKVKVKAHDPIALDTAKKLYPDMGIVYCDSVLEAVAGADAVVLVTEWPAYRDLPWKEIRDQVRNPLVLDGRNFLNQTKLIQLGFRHVGVG